MRKFIKSAIIALFSVTIFAACFALFGCNSTEEENYYDYTLDGFVYSVSGQTPIYVDADEMSPTDHYNYDTVIQMYGTKVSISDNYIEFNGTVLSYYGKIGYQIVGNDVILAEPALTQTFNYVKLTNGIFYFGIQIEISGMTVTYTFEYYSSYVTTPTYQVTFDSLGGSSVNTATVTKGEAVTKPANPTRTGYTFAGWFIDSECKIEWDFDANKVYSVTTLYAKWNAKSNNIKFESNGGSKIATKAVTTGNKVSKPSDPSRTGYTFSGWYTESSLKNLYNFSAVVTGDMTLYAKWAPKQYTITFDANGGTCDTASKQVTYDTKVGALPTPTREHHTFGGWYYSYGDGYYTSETFYTHDESITLYAWWNVDTVVFNFNAQGGTCSETSITYKYNKALGEMPVPEREGFVFGGWFTSTAGKGTEYTATSVCNKTSETTLYAKWVAQITINYEGATSGTGAAKFNYTYNASISLNLPQPYKTGYSFEGWYTKQEGQGTILTNTKLGTSTVWNLSGNADIYAYWVKGTDKRYIDYTASNGSVTINGLKDTTLKQLDIPAIIDSLPVKVIKYLAFWDTGLTAVTLPDGLTTIEDSAFSNCRLTTITIPNSVTSIGYHVFKLCPLTEISIPFVGISPTVSGDLYKGLFGYIFGQSANKDSTDYSVKQFDGKYGALYREIWCYIPETLEKVTVTGDCALSEYAFSGCTMIKEINFTGKVTYISESAFADCTKLQKITFGSEAPVLAENALKNMSASTKIIVPDEYVEAYREKYPANTVVGKSEEE